MGARGIGMAMRGGVRATLATTLLLGGCAGFELPSVDALNPFAGRPAVTPSDPTVTNSPVGAEIARIRRTLADLRAESGRADAELTSLQAQIAAAETRYRGLRDDLSSRLAAGATPGDAALVGQWREAETALGAVEQHLAQVTSRQAGLAQHVARAGAVVDRVREARGIPGGNAEDVRQLDLLAGQAGETRTATDRTLNVAADEVARRSAEVAAARRELSALSVAIASGRLAASDLAARVAPVAGSTAPGMHAPETRRPLVTIGFAHPDVDFRQPLYNGVSAAVARAPGVGFDVVAVAPASGEPAEQARALAASRGHAEHVAQSIVGMGVPAARVRVAARGEPGVTGSEVRVYVR